MRKPFLPLTLATVLCLSCCLRVLAEDKTKEKTPVVKKIEVKGRLPFQRGRFGKPKEIKSAKELTSALPEAVAKEVAKEVDFDKQLVLVFAWSGSGQDKVTAKEDAENKGNVIFQYRPGRTRDLRPHVHVFAVRKDSKWKIQRGGFGR